MSRLNSAQKLQVEMRSLIGGAGLRVVILIDEHSIEGKFKVHCRLCPSVVYILLVYAAALWDLVFY